MPLDIDLNTPYNGSEAVDSLASVMECNRPREVVSDKENRAPSIDLNHPSSSVSGVFPIDLNAYPPNEEEEEEEVSYNEYDNDHGVDHVDDICLEQVVDILTEIQHDPNEDRDDDDFGDTMTEGAQSEVEPETQPSRKKRRFLDNNERKVISQLLIKESCNGILNPGIVSLVASSFSVSIDVIYRIWRQVTDTGDACHKRTKNCGRKRVSIDIEKVRDISLSKRTTLRSLARAMGASTKALLKYLKEGVLRRHTNGLKPSLKDDNMKARLRFCLSMLEESSIPHDPVFKSMYNVVHIDEKWFYMSKKSVNYYLLASEDEPYRTCRNKNFIGKVMFLVAMARPRFDDEGNETFSGKIGTQLIDGNLEREGR